MAYLVNNSTDERCIFCHLLQLHDGPENLIIHRSSLSFIVLNRYPYTSGHLMVVPIAHQPTLDGLNPATRADMMELTTQASLVLQKIYHPQGFNIGINIGEAAGAGILDHIHLHVVPRWIGDTNFMSALGETRVLPETLEVTYSRVQSAWMEAHRPESPG
jgi:ATP adenylyltransferase